MSGTRSAEILIIRFNELMDEMEMCHPGNSIKRGGDIYNEKKD